MSLESDSTCFVSHRVELSLKSRGRPGAALEGLEEGAVVRGRVKRAEKFGVFVELDSGATGWQWRWHCEGVLGGCLAKAVPWSWNVWGLHRWGGNLWSPVSRRPMQGRVGTAGM